MFDWAMREGWFSSIMDMEIMKIALFFANFPSTLEIVVEVKEV